MFLRHTTNYILSLLLWPTVIITFCLCGVVWLMQAVHFIDFIINRGLSVQDFLYLTMLLLPSLLAYILPIALVIAVIFTYYKLITDSELIVMQASGFSRWQLLRPALIAAMIVCIIVYFLTLKLLPLANREFRDMKEFLKENYASVMLQEEVFNHPIEGITVFIQSRSQTSNGQSSNNQGGANQNGKLQGILVHDSRNPKNTITMMAEQAELVQTSSGPKFLLENGIRQEMQDGKLSWLNFASYNLDLSYYTKRNATRRLNQNELTTHDLWQTVQLGKLDGNSKNGLNMMELNWRIAWPIMVIFLSLIAFSNVTSGEFQRRGLWKKLCATSALTVAGVIGFFLMLNMIDDSDISVTMLYGYMGCLLIFGLLRNMDYRFGNKPKMLNIAS